jgi:hypothetical protein
MDGARVSPTLWLGIIIIVCILECLRIGMTTYVLLHLLQDPALRRPGEGAHQATRSLRTARLRSQREALLDPTLGALRGAMDDVALGRAGSQVEHAITALDRYAQALVDERGQA